MNRQTFFKQLEKRFSLEELKTLAFKLEIDYEKFPTATKGIFIRELVSFLERNGRLSELIHLAAQERPSTFNSQQLTINNQQSSIVNRQSSIVNPFTDKFRINDPARFYGRSRILSEMRQLLAAGNSISLVGDTQIGKSSLLYYLHKAGPQLRPAYLNLQSVIDEADFCAELLDLLNRPPGDLRQVRNALREQSLNLILDEVEQLAQPEFTPRLQDILRSLVEDEHLLLIVASQRPLTAVFTPTSPTSPLHNVFTTRQLGPFTPAEAAGFLRHRLQTTPITFTPAEIDNLIDQSGCHPVRLQQAARRLFEEKGS